MNNIYLDLETIPSQSAEYRAEVRKNITAPAQYKKPESIAEWIANNGDAAADDIIAKTSFDPAHGHICCIGWAINDNPVETSSVYLLGDSDEPHAIREFFESLPETGMCRFIGHHISGFDLRFLLCRAVVLGVKLPPSVTFPRDIKPWSDNVFDTMVAWAGPRGTISQRNLAAALGIAVHDDFDGSMVAELWAAGKHEDIASHCRSDIETVRAIHKRFELVGF